jgi:hypothetical protein
MQRDLVERARSGDHDAFEALTAAAFDRLYAVARRILRDKDRTDDAVQECLALRPDSPDGSRFLLRAPRGATPGHVLVVTADGTTKADIRAGQWSSMDWQPVVNPDNPAANAPEGLPAF